MSASALAFVSTRFWVGGRERPAPLGSAVAARRVSMLVEPSIVGSGKHGGDRRIARRRVADPPAPLVEPIAGSEAVRVLW
jgi:hypothetical protein